jgi:hypothetical protein
MRVEDLGFRVEGLGFRVSWSKDLGLKVEDLGLRSHRMSGSVEFRWPPRRRRRADGHLLSCLRVREAYGRRVQPEPRDRLLCLLPLLL